MPSGFGYCLQQPMLWDKLTVDDQSEPAVPITKKPGAHVRTLVGDLAAEILIGGGFRMQLIGARTKGREMSSRPLQRAREAGDSAPALPWTAGKGSATVQALRSADRCSKR